MKISALIFVALFFSPALVLGGEKEQAYLAGTMIPLAQKFLARIGLTNSLPITTNQVMKFKVDYFDDRIGCMASLKLTNGFTFGFHTETNKTEVWSFHRTIKTYYALENPPKEKIIALKALNLQNKLNLHSAQSLAEKYFKLIGHQLENFHSLDFYPPGITQGYWVSTSDPTPASERHLPYYEITLYRKDVTKLQLDEHDSNAELKFVMIEVSGIDLGLVSYSKGMLPIGSDF